MDQGRFDSGSTGSEEWITSELSDDEQKNSQPLDPYIDVAQNYNTPHQLINTLVDELRQIDPQTFHKRASVVIGMKVILLNGFLARHDCGAQRRVHYSRRSDSYTGMKVNHSTLVNVISALHERGYVHSFVVPQGSHNLFRSSFGVRSNLWRLCERFEFHPRMITSESVVELRAPKKKTKNPKGESVKQRGSLIPTKDRKVVGLELRRRNLKQINSMYRGFIGLFVPDEKLSSQPRNFEREAYKLALDRGTSKSERYIGNRPNFRRTTLKRVFNNVDRGAPKLDQGGRFCGVWWQEVPGAIRRSNIWIGGEPAVELDYNSMEVSLAYAEQGLILKEAFEDPYSAFSDIERTIAKRMLLIALNCDNRPSALAAINKYLKVTAPERSLVVAKFLDELEELHCPYLGELYGTERAMKRMHTESKITEAILLRAKKANEVVLPVHDSYLVRESQKDQLRRWMEDSFMDISKVVTSGITLEDRDSTDLPYEVNQEDYSVFFRLAGEHQVVDDVLGYRY